MIESEHNLVKVCSGKTIKHGRTLPCTETVWPWQSRTGQRATNRMPYSLTLQDYIQNYHPHNIPSTLGNSLTSYTNQYIRSAEVRHSNWVCSLSAKSQVRNMRETCRISSRETLHLRHLKVIPSGIKWMLCLVRLRPPS